MKVAKEAQAKRKQPDFHGVPGQLVPLPDLEFAERAMRLSPYDPLLKQLEEAGAGKALQFDDLRARTSLKVRARKLGLRISFAERGKTLFVRFDGHTDDDLKGNRRKGIKEALKFGPRAAMELVNFLRDKGDGTIDLPMMDAILGQMLRAGDVVKQEGGKWARNPAAKAAAA